MPHFWEDVRHPLWKQRQTLQRAAEFTVNELQTQSAKMKYGLENRVIKSSTHGKFEG